MKQLVFSDAQYWEEFLPLSFTRPIACMRVGILTFQERWEKLLGFDKSFFITEKYLQIKYPAPKQKEALLIVPNFLPTTGVLQQIKNLKKGEALVYENEVIASYIDLDNFHIGQLKKCIDITENLMIFKKPWDLFSYNDKAIAFDFPLVTGGRSSQSLSATNRLRGNIKDIFIEEGAEVEYASLNTQKGPIYIGKEAEVMEGAMLRGPVTLGEHSVIKMGAKIYGACTFGPHVKIGGEVSDVVIFGYTSKGHDGYLGNSVMGEWCNLGADTNTSNLKNNYAPVKMWSYAEKTFKPTELQFCGTIMGDHSKTAINTQLNTGTTVGVACNIFKAGFPPNLVGNFSWGGENNAPKFHLDKVYETAEIVMSRRKITLSEEDKAILKYIYHQF
ncbi:glucose-1-phosphate thymidylyltransferase [Elizabethkingia argentiflava]|uniref:Glucose-1-phosphate thymidylyltransferase n=1 Tax=Elizabethkingia argenteiflava TaxID=2681556 RepID=A0A845PXM7_9FLAO|nr:putative sugar nucleotidyl transferase [Elizabethkingia argenteiflava]NAW51227.1 glucose-1-phosphate thymidylyltransferase [Elizabethkingia argenteiflava]